MYLFLASNIGVGDYAFSRCSSLTQVNIPESVNSIGESAFYKCSSLAQINIPARVTSIENYTFIGCSSLTQITIPESVNRIGIQAFFECSSLTTVFCKPTIPPSLSNGYHVPFESEYVRWIYVPAESLNDYKTDYRWSDYSDIIRGYKF